MKNWKSLMAYLIFVAVYVYSVTIPSTDSVVSTTGYIALIMSVVMVLRNQVTTQLLDKMLDVYKERK